MTRQRHDSNGTEFGDWLRNKHQDRIGSHRFSAQNLDYIWHDYRANWLITIEEKRYGGMRSQRAQKAQKDTHGIVMQLLWRGSGSVVETMRGSRPVEYRGHYEIIFENTNPDDGGFTINGVPGNQDMLLELLTTGRCRDDDN